ncbi:forkhead box N1 [Saccoglossus kowalevskii]|uniref:Forkhead box N protein n=1 Tax=Saccoglossus kowalevskii TaxID=10224 RepID=B5THL9_SACKO|nr:forkhead box N1 [Saccoglossus kowalevskii]ACH73227.1 forkhead box N protein [Saccoglossus kowalevskii]
MDYFDGHTELSVEDIFEHNVRSEMDQLLSSTAERFVTQSSGGEGISTYTVQGSTITEQPLPTDLANLNWLHGVDMTDFSHISAETFQNHNLLVDPQTAVPIRDMQQLANQVQQQVQSGVMELPEVSISNMQDQLPAYTITQTIPAAQNLQQEHLQPTMQYRTTPSQQQNMLFTNVSTSKLAPTIVSVTSTATTSQLAQQQPRHQQTLNVGKNDKKTADNNLNAETKVYPKPAYSYSCLIAMALKNSKTGCLPVSEIYHFMCENFPYFKTAPDGWKNSVRHNLSLNKCFEKIEKPPGGGSTRKGCLWALNPNKAAKMDDEIQKWRKKDPIAIRRSSAKPEELDQLERGRVPSPSPPPPPQPVQAVDIKPMEDHYTAKAVSDVLFTGEAQLLDVNLDPHLADISLQNGLWDDFRLDDSFSLDLPTTNSNLSFSTSPLHDASSGQEKPNYSSLDATSQYAQFTSPGPKAVSAFM